MRVPLLLAALLLAGCADAPPAATSPEPFTYAALGDSITRAAMAGAVGEMLEHSWATGVDPDDGVESHAERLLAAHPGLVVRNLAESGARMADLPGQAKAAVDAGADHVTILLGANDVCGQTPLDAVASDLRAAAAILASGLPEATVEVYSVPDVPQLASLFADDANAVVVRGIFRVCPAILTPGADLAAARARADAIDGLLAEAVADEQAAGRAWTWDGGAVAAQAFDVADVSDLDYFHPSVRGQARLAEATWRATHPS